MKLIVTQKHMNLPKLIVVACSAIVLALSGNKLSARAADPQLGNSKRTFADWCRQKADLSPETKHTVDVLLEQAGTNDCDAADRKLSSLTELFFEFKKISDIKPLASLTNLTRLGLSNTQSGDIKPLASLTNLTQLNLWGNQIGDIKPLASLTNLTHLSLIDNAIDDIKPLASLTNLTVIDLNDNQIGDIKPLASLTHLTQLYLSDNAIDDIKPLASLTNLTQLDLGGNLIAPNCPLSPESICNWEPSSVLKLAPPPPELPPLPPT